MKKQTVLSLLLCGLILIGLLAGCAGETGPVTTPSEKPSAAPAEPSAPTQSETPTEQPKETFTYPLGADELTYWYPLYPEILANISDFNEKNYSWIEGEKRTGIHIKWTTPNLQQINELFNVMIVSGDLTDMILYADTYTGGGEAAVNDGVYARLNEYMEVNTPAYNTWLSSNEKYFKDSRTDSGLIYAIYGLTETTRKAGGGLVWRQDVAAKIGWNKAPETITEFNKFLYDYKEASGKTGFFSPPQYGFISDGTYGMLPTSFGAATRMVNVNGTVQYGPIMPGFKDYVAQMKQWYDDGIIDPDFMSKAYFMTWADVAGGKYVVAHGVPGIVGSKWGSNYADVPEMYIAAIGPFDGENGIKASCGTYMTTYNGSPTAISASSSKIETALRWLDFWYTDEGAILKCYGIEGETYNIVNGDPVWSDLITKNETIVVAQCTGGVFINTYTGPGFQYCIYDNEDVEIACNVWADFDPSWNMPPIAMTADESAEYAGIMADIETFCAETIANYISGSRSLDDFDSYFVNQVKSMNIDKAVALQQAALERYAKR